MSAGPALGEIKCNTITLSQDYFIIGTDYFIIRRILGPINRALLHCLLPGYKVLEHPRKEMIFLPDPPKRFSLAVSWSLSFRLMSGWLAVYM